MSDERRAAAPPAPAAGSPPTLVWLDGPAGAAPLGGKAAPLVRLAAAGLPVPPGFVVLPEAFPARPPGEADGPVRLAPAVRVAIGQALDDLGRRVGEGEPLVAVRSSATVEDLPGASFAGQYETYLGVRGTAAVLERIVDCWASLWTPHAAAYREHAAARAAAPLPEPAMAVLVQVLVDATAAGVAFTADPISGDAATVTVNAAWGLGQSVVDGAVEADVWQVDRRRRRTLRQTTGRKETRSGIGPDAARVPVPADEQALPCLTAPQVEAVVDLALRAEAVAGAPVDVEWAVAAGDGAAVWLLQARPITTGRDGAGGSDPPAAPPAESAAKSAAESPVGPSPAFPFRWPDAAAAGRTWRVQTWGRPERPLSQEVTLAFRRARDDAAGIKGDEWIERTLMLNGYAYTARAPAPSTEAARDLARVTFERTSEALHERGETYLQAVVFPELDAANARLGAVDPAALAPGALADHLEEAMRWFVRAWTLHWLWAANGPRERFGRLYATATGDERREAAGELLIHEPNLFTDAVDGLIELARIAQGHPALARLLAQSPPAAALAALRATPDLEGGAAFGAALERLLERQGLRCGAGFGVEAEEMLPGWREDPSLVLALVTRYVGQDLDAVIATREAAVAARDRRTAEVRRGLPDDETRERFDFWLSAARRAQQGFEDHNYKIDSAASSLLHRAISGAGARLAAAGCLDDPARVWFLRAHEIALALRGLDDPAAGAADWRRLVAARAARHEWQASLTPPPRLGAPPEPAAPPAGRPEPPAGAAAPPPPDALVSGQTGAAGVATGRVRLVGREVLVPDVRPGDVLVAHNAGPLWAAIFPTVAAVVLDEGVFFQHAMLTCREYAVPAIFQTGDATRRLTEGQRVTVDATRGCVLPAAPATPATPAD